MHFVQANDEVAQKFRYIKDDDQYKFTDVWWVVDTRREYWEGDCEDYALTVVWLMSDRKIWKFLYNLLINPKLSLRYVTTKRGVGHVVLEYDEFFVDNIQRKWFIRTDPAYKEYTWRFRVIPPMILAKFLVSAPFLLWSLFNKNYRK